MNIFNSLGSNYDLSFVFKSLFSNTSMYQGELEKLVKDKYQGAVLLLYKGRETIELALKISNLPKDSFVVINGFTCFAVYEAVKNAGLNVEYLDLVGGDLNFSADALKKAVEKNPKVKAVIIQNTLGYPCDIKGIKKICEEKKLILIEDLAHSVGTKYADGQEAGTVGDFTVLSFSQDKIIDGISGGALIIRNKKYSNHEIETNLHPGGVSTKQQTIDRLYPLFTFLIRKTYPFLIGKIIHEILKRLNLLSKPVEDVDAQRSHSLPNWYTGLIRAAFNQLDENLNHRKIIASIYDKNINPKVISKVLGNQINLSSCLRFPIFVNNRGELIKFLEGFGIYISDIWYDAPIAPKKYLSQTDYKNQCPNSELASDSILNLPTHKNVSAEDAKNISDLINKWLTQ